MKVDHLNPYHQGADLPPLLVQSFCLFIDCLGYADANTRELSVEEHREQFVKFYSAIKKHTEDIRAEDPEWSSFSKLWQVKIFSDNIVIGSPLSRRTVEEYHEGLVGSILMSVIDLQLRMVLDGFFLRGGWALGLLAMDELTVYGDALVRSYLLEKDACFPRIIMDNEVQSLITAALTFYSKDYVAPQEYHIISDANNRLFLNYLYPLSGIETGEGPFFEQLELHKRLVEDNLTLNISNPGILAKYLWLADYHNYFCQSFIENCPKKYFVTAKPVHSFKPLRPRD